MSATLVGATAALGKDDGATSGGKDWGPAKKCASRCMTSKFKDVVKPDLNYEEHTQDPALKKVSMPCH